MSRNSSSHGFFILNPVEDFSVFAGFSCLDDNAPDRDLDDFIQNDAERHFKDKIAITYMLTTQRAIGVPIGFATLQNDAIVTDNANRLPELQDYPYNVSPAVKIGRLGIRNDLQKLGYGTLLLNLIKKMMVTENRTGCRFLTVDAWRDKRANIDVSKFYEKNGFILLETRQKTSKTIPMYYDLARFVPWE